MFTYPPIDDISNIPKRNLNLKSPNRIIDGKIRIAIIGAGAFSKSTHLPNIKELNNIFHLKAVVNRTGPSAKSVGEQFGADYISTDPHDVLKDPEVDAVLIATRHQLHGSLVLTALQAGKHVLVEKPLTLSKEELISLQEFYEEDIADNKIRSKPILLTGYNRRFSPYVRQIQ